MKNINFKTFKFSTIIKKIYSLKYHFNQIFKLNSIRTKTQNIFRTFKIPYLKLYSATKSFKSIKLKKVNIFKIYKYLDHKKYNLLKVLEIKKIRNFFFIF